MAAPKIRKGDTVKVIAGKDLGAQGRVLVVFPQKSKVIIEGVNRVTRHEKLRMGRGRAGTQGGIIHKEGAIDISNVALVCANDGATRVGYRIDEDSGTKSRVCRKCGGEL